MEKLLNFNEPIDVTLLDDIVAALYGPNAQARVAAQNVLTQFQDHVESWTRVDTILEHSKSINSKFFALGILESVIKYKWKALPIEQCEGIKNYVVGLVIKIGSDEVSIQRDRLFLSKLNVCFVQIIKHEWPHNWPNFIPEIVASSKTNECLCENNMSILKSFSEEVFDFSGGHMTQAKIKELKQNLSKGFSLVYELCEFILDRAQRPSLLLITLETFLRFLNWIPVGYIFDTKVIESLTMKFFPVPAFRNVTLQCLTEIADLTVGNLYDPHFRKLFTLFMGQINTILPPTTDIARAYSKGSESDQIFIHNLALFFLAFFKYHLPLVETPEFQPLLLDAHILLVRISQVTDVEIFKICNMYWNLLATDIHRESTVIIARKTMTGNQPRRELYANILSKVRAVMVSRMAKPEEVLIVEDENGEIVKEVMKDSDAISLYKSMRETLVFLTHLDYDNTQDIMVNKLAAQVDGTEWNWHNLNVICWAIGSISGTLEEETETRFLVTVIKDLLELVELRKGKDNKAVVASNIMYIVGQYPRFLRAHWKFLKTVINKLFEFMHETHPGVQDMACDTFLKISQKCRKKFVVVQYGENFSFIEEILETMPTIIRDLETHQIHVFYEAVGYMISSQDDTQLREQLISKYMALPNQQWKGIIAQAGQQFEFLLLPETIKIIGNILKVNVRAAVALGTCFASQLGKILMDILSVYKVFSEHISNTVAKNGTSAARTSLLLSMRAVKKESLRLFETFIEKTAEPELVYRNYVPPLLEAVLGDYHSNIPDARDPEVLSLLTIIIAKVRNIITPDVPRILDAIFECTLSMLTKNFEDYPEHRKNFFHLLRALNSNCFDAFFSMPEQSFKLVLDSVVWAFKHAERNISETGLNILFELLHNIAANDNVSNAFYEKYFLLLLQDVFFVLTDSFHKSGFKLQAAILKLMFTTVESGAVKVRLWDTATLPDPTMTNQRFLREYVMRFLQFPNMSPHQLQIFVAGLFDLSKDLSTYKQHLRDFLVQTKEFSNKYNTELYLEEQEAAREAALRRQMEVPGLIRPIDQPYAAGMDD